MRGLVLSGMGRATVGVARAVDAVRMIAPTGRCPDDWLATIALPGCGAIPHRRVPCRLGGLVPPVGLGGQ